MRKADRLFEIIQILRRARGPVTARALAEELEVAKRTVYRDIAHLIAQRVPITGEAGFGYVLDAGYDMPPLMLTPEEIEAVALGLEMVARLHDPALRHAARDAISKIASVVPEAMLPYVEHPAVRLKPEAVGDEAASDTRPLRLAIREGRKLNLIYRAVDGAVSNRIVWPVLLGYDDAHSLLIAWCQTKQAFRHFRTDRILEVAVLDEKIGVSRSKLRQQWQDWHNAFMEEVNGRA